MDTLNVNRLATLTVTVRLSTLVKLKWLIVSVLPKGAVATLTVTVRLSTLVKLK